jgi:hypothetical protein
MESIAKLEKSVEVGISPAPAARSATHQTWTSPCAGLLGTLSYIGSLTHTHAVQQSAACRPMLCHDVVQCYLLYGLLHQMPTLLQHWPEACAVCYLLYF